MGNRLSNGLKQEQTQQMFIYYQEKTKTKVREETAISNIQCKTAQQYES